MDWQILVNFIPIFDSFDPYYYFGSASVRNVPVVRMTFLANEIMSYKLSLFIVQSEHGYAEI
jgi:hypothetical protein